MSRGWQVVVKALAWAVILAATGSLSAAVLVPRLAGATPYAVLTGSMRPALPSGTLVVVRPVEMGDVSVGDVITYQLRSGDPTVVTHRVVGSGVRTDGTAVLTTQGDANDVVDAAPVQPEQMRGRLWYAVPHLGKAHSLLGGFHRKAAVQLVAAGLLLYAGRMFVAAAPAWRGGPGSRTSDDDQEKEGSAR